MSTAKYPNRDALRKAHDVYLDAMYLFVSKCLDRVKGTTAEKLIRNALRLELHSDIEEDIEISDIAHLVRTYWYDSFQGEFEVVDRYYEARSAVGLIVEGRDRASHPPWDLDPEFTRTHLSLIAEVLGKISKPDQQREVETIRDELFFDNTAERLTEAEERLKVSERENAKYKKSLTEAERRLEARESERDEYEKDNTTLSKQVDEEEKYLKKLSKQLKRARAENDKYKKNLAGTKQRLEKSEAAQADYKKRLEVALEELKDTKEESRAPEESLTAAEEHLLTSVAKRYIAETTEEDRNGVARQVAELRINASGSRPLRWPSIREKLGLKKDEFHKVIRPSKGYRTAVIDRIKSLKGSGKGWEYSGKLEFLTGIDISESDLA